METGLQIATDAKTERRTSRCLLVGVWLFVALQTTLMVGVVALLRTSAQAIVEAQASIARMESVATSAHAEFRGVSETVRDASRTFHELVDSEAGTPKVVEGALGAAWAFACPRLFRDPYYDGLDCDALDRVARGVVDALVRANGDAGGANLTLVDALAAAPFVDLSPLFAASTTVGTILASMTSVRRSNAKGVKSFDLLGPRLAAVGGALAQIEPVLGPVNAQLLQRAPKSADDAKSLTKMIEGFATWFAPFGSATSLPALGQVCVDVIDVVETVPLEHDYTLHDVAPPTNYEWDKCNVHEEIASPGDDVPCKYPDCEGRECYKHHGYEGNAPRPFLQCHYTAATTVDCKITVAASLPDAEAWGVVRAYCAEVAAFKPAA